MCVSVQLRLTYIPVVMQTNILDRKDDLCSEGNCIEDILNCFDVNDKTVGIIECESFKG